MRTSGIRLRPDGQGGSKATLLCSCAAEVPLALTNGTSKLENRLLSILDMSEAACCASKGGTSPSVTGPSLGGLSALSRLHDPSPPRCTFKSDVRITLHMAPGFVSHRGSRATRHPLPLWGAPPALPRFHSLLNPLTRLLSVALQPPILAPSRVTILANS